MLRLIVVAAALICCLDAAPRSRRPLFRDRRIVGGTDADIKDFPHQLSYMYYSMHNCGASIISEEWAITAAHCSDGVGPEEVSLRAGSSILEEGGEVYEIATIIMHEDFNYYTIDNDISVLKVVKKFKFGPGVGAIPLASASPAVGTIVTITGWGATEESGMSSNHLQKVQVPVVDHETCNKDYKDYGGITASMMCAGVPAGGKDACQGDSGGPYVANGELVGLVSWGVGCARAEYPGVAADVAYLRNWVTNKTGI